MRKLKWLVLSLTFLSLTLITSVYAWLQISNINMIDNIVLGVRSGDELEISLDGINYYKSLDLTHTKELIKDLSFKDVTTTDNKTFSFGPMLSFTEALKNRDYLSLDLHFRVTPEAEIEDYKTFKDIYLVKNNQISYDNAKKELVEGTYITSKGKSWKSDYSFNNGSLVNKGDILTTYAKDAMRIGILSKDNEFIFDPSGNEERGFGKSYGAFDYYNVKNEFKTNLPSKTPKTLYELSEELGNTGIMNDNKSHVVRVEKSGDYYYGEATINIWLEGWDADAFDAIRRDHILIQLGFQVARHLEGVV